MKLKIISVLIIVLLLVVGCTNDKTQVEGENVEKAENTVNFKKIEDESPLSQKEQQKEAEEFLEQLETTKNKTLEKQIENEKGVVQHQIFIMEKLGLAGGELIVGKEVKDDEGKRLAEKYAQQMKKEYSNLGIAITVIRDGKEITTVEID
ncbi:hypothetical protein [Lysinibacillus boronitolerans]|uniref:hypothetical protein n=1 Tax=Lysinibacillus boronitolerans TaxID=309788 RepID=UPI003851E48E